MHKLTRLAPLAAAACVLAAPAAASAAPTPYQTAVLASTPAPALYWTLDDVAGPTVADLSGNAHAGNASAAVAFGAAGAFAYANTSAGLPGGATITGEPGSAPQVIELWVRPAAKGAQTLAGQGDPAGSGWELALSARKKLVFTSGGKTVDPKVTLPVGAWSMVDVAWSGKAVWFVTNGGLAKSKGMNNALSGAPTATTTLTLGSAGGTLGKGLDEVALYPTAPATFNDFKALAKGHFNATALAQNTVLPSIVVPAGGLVDGQTLTVTPGTWASSTPVTTPYAYRWLRCDLPSSDVNQSCDYIDGATASSYTLSPADVGAYLVAEETATNSAGSTFVDSADSGVTDPLAPTISGTADEGATLTAVPHTSTGAPLAFTFEWQRCDAAGTYCVPIGGETAGTYVLKAADATKTIRVVASVGTGSAPSAATPVITAASAALAAPVSAGKPTVDGILVAGQTLTAASGLWTANPLPTFTYQWLRCMPAGGACAPIAGAVGPAYVLTGADVDHTIAVRVTADNGQPPAAQADSDPTGLIAAAPATDPGTNPGPNPGSGGTGSNPGSNPGTSTPGIVIGCAVRLASVPKARSAKVRGLGRVKVTVQRGKGAALRLVIKANKGNVSRIAVKLDRKALKGSKRALRRTVSLKALKAGRHTLRVTVTPKHGKARTLSVALKLKSC